MKILFTGASGMLGKAFMALFSEKHELKGISKSGKDTVPACDLSSQEEVDKLFQRSSAFDVVIHSAAYSDVDGCERDPALAFESNGTATKILAEACGKRQIPFIYVSTDYVFSGDAAEPYEIGDPVFPVNIYGMTKLAGECFAMECCPVSAIVRTSWLFGAGNSNNFVNAIISRLRGEPVVRALDDQSDSPTYVKDLSEALEKIAARLVQRGKAVPAHEIFQVCNAGVTTRYTMTQKIRDLLGVTTSVEKADRGQIKNRLAIRPPYAAMSTKHYEEVFGERLRPWEASLKEYVNSL